MRPTIHAAAPAALLAALLAGCTDTTAVRDAEGDPGGPVVPGDVGSSTASAATTDPAPPAAPATTASATGRVPGADDPRARFPVADAVAGDPESWPGDPIPEGQALHATPSGLRFAVLEEGEGEGPGGLFDTVRAHYSGFFTDGRPFDSSVGGEPFVTRLDGVVPGWGEGLQLMRPGARFKLVLPAELGYGKDGRMGIPPDTTLVFDIELVSVEHRVELPDFVLPLAADCVTTESGLMMQVVTAGDGEAVALEDPLKLAYTAWLTDGRVLDSSVVRGGPLAMSPKQVTLEGLREGLQLMRGGGRARFVIPPALAYGEKGMGHRVPPDSALVYDIEIVAHLRPLEPPPFRMPEGDDLVTTPSGLQFLVLEEGEGERPGPAGRVFAHYAGWFTDGTPFDDSYQRGEASEFTLDRVIAGWTEGLQLMRPGSRYLFVVPPDLAYGPGGRPGIPPNSTLVFDVTLEGVGEP